MKHIKNNFLVVSDYNWLPNNIEESWVYKYSDNFLIYDRFHRFKENDKIKWQKNVGQNIYDIFDFIVNNYQNLPNGTIFCRASFLNPKDTGTPRFDERGHRISNGNCSEEFFLKNANNTHFTELQDFTLEPWRFSSSPDSWNKIGPENSYLELNNNWYFGTYPSRYYTSLDAFFNDMYTDYTHLDYIRFSPGGCYIIPKQHILKQSKKFYERVREILSWDIIIGEAHMIERALYTIFNNNYTVRDIYK
jgi:hypothetical protein